MEEKNTLRYKVGDQIIISSKDNTHSSKHEIIDIKYMFYEDESCYIVDRSLPPWCKYKFCTTDEEIDHDLTSHIHRLKNKKKMDNYPESLGKLIRIQRMKRGLSLEELGSIIGLARSTLQRWEVGETKSLDIRIIIKISRALDIPMDDIVLFFQERGEDYKQETQE